MKKLTFKKKVTIIGINGFLGSNLASYLKKKFLIKKFNKINYNINYGTIIYCAGTTFVNKNYYNLVESHITLLNKIINKVQFEKLIYLSSTRVYMNAKETLTDTCFNKVSNKEDSIFNLSKILGESICLSSLIFLILSITFLLISLKSVAFFGIGLSDVTERIL